jgi:hypothetical protein
MHLRGACALLTSEPACFFAQSKLNCEVLWDDLAFEVRWAVAGDSVVLQLVSKLGKSRQRGQHNALS